MIQGYDVVMIYWHDASMSEDSEHIMPIPAISVGIVWEQHEDYITIAGDRYNNDTQSGRRFMCIPRGMIDSITHLYEAEDE